MDVGQCIIRKFIFAFGCTIYFHSLGYFNSSFKCCSKPSTEKHLQWGQSAGKRGAQALICLGQYVKKMLQTTLPILILSKWTYDVNQAFLNNDCYS